MQISEEELPQRVRDQLQLLRIEFRPLRAHLVEQSVRKGVTADEFGAGELAPAMSTIGSAGGDYGNDDPGLH